MTTVYRKSAKGQHEIETRADRLGPRLRTALILVDGRRSDSDLRALIQLDPDATLLALLEGGYIDVLSTAAPLPAQSAEPAVAATSSAAATAPMAPVSTAAALAERRRLAVRHLTDQLGPVVEELAMRIEKTRTWAELRPELELGMRVMQRSRGADAAARFAELFIDTPPG